MEKINCKGCLRELEEKYFEGGFKSCSFCRERGRDRIRIKYLDYVCSVCDFKTHIKTHYEKHMISARHLRGGKNVKYICEKCNHETINKTVHTNHIKTKKHHNLMNSSPQQMPTIE